MSEWKFRDHEKTADHEWVTWIVSYQSNDASFAHLSGEATSLTSRRHHRRKDPPFFGKPFEKQLARAFLTKRFDSDREASPMPPNSNSNSLPRSKTFISVTSSKSRKRAVTEQYANMDRLQKAKSKAEKAIKVAVRHLSAKSCVYWSHGSWKARTCVQCIA